MSTHSTSSLAQVAGRRWRILRAALPNSSQMGAQPPWVRSFDEFIWWVAGELSRDALNAYLGDLEIIAKKTCDLVLLRLARDYT
jgi:hypothetical protein